MIAHMFSKPNQTILRRLEVGSTANWNDSAHKMVNNILRERSEAPGGDQ